MAAAAPERTKLERLCRYVNRPTLSEQRLSLTPQGNIRYALKTPYRDGTTHVVFDPLDLLARLVRPGTQRTAVHHSGAAHGSAAMTWAQPLKRVFAIDIEQCERCGGKVRIIASIQQPEVIEKILRHLESKPGLGSQCLARGPPTRVRRAVRLTLPKQRGVVGGARRDGRGSSDSKYGDCAGWCSSERCPELIVALRGLLAALARS